MLLIILTAKAIVIGTESMQVKGDSSYPSQQDWFLPLQYVSWLDTVQSGYCIAIIMDQDTTHTRGKTMKKIKFHHFQVISIYYKQSRLFLNDAKMVLTPTYNIICFERSWRVKYICCDPRMQIYPFDKHPEYRSHITVH